MAILELIHATERRPPTPGGEACIYQYLQPTARQGAPARGRASGTRSGDSR